MIAPPNRAVERTADSCTLVAAAHRDREAVWLDGTSHEARKAAEKEIKN